MSADPQAELSRTLALLAGAASSLAVALPAPGDVIARVIATGLGVVGLLLREGASVDEAIAAIRRVRHIDTSADDAEVDRKVDAKEPKTILGVPVPEYLRKPIGKRFQELRPVMQVAEVESLEPPKGMWGEPGEGD